MLLFDPVEKDNMHAPIQNLVHLSLHKLHESDNAHLLKNDNFKSIQVTGGTTNLKGFRDVFSNKVHNVDVDFSSK